MSPAQLIIDTRERVYQHIKDSPDGLTEEGVFDALKGEAAECQGARPDGPPCMVAEDGYTWIKLPNGCWTHDRRALGRERAPKYTRMFIPRHLCERCQGTGQKTSDPLAPWLVHACLGYLLAEARIIDTSDDATEYRWVVLSV